MSIPGAASPLFLATTAGAAAGFEISRSLRFNSGDSSYLNRTPSSAGNRKTFTWSGWVKRGNSNADHHLFVADKASSASLADNTFNRFYILASGQLHFGGYSTGYRRTIALLRDPAAFYHLVLAVDTSQSTPDDRIKIYINGVQVANADFELKNNPSQNYDLAVNNSNVHTIGARSRSGSLGFYLDGYLAEVNFIDGQALAPTDFGAPDDNGVWQAKEFEGTYGPLLDQSRAWSGDLSASNLASPTLMFNWTYGYGTYTGTCTWTTTSASYSSLSGRVYLANNTTVTLGITFKDSGGTTLGSFNLPWTGNGTQMQDTGFDWSSSVATVEITGNYLPVRVQIGNKTIVDSGVTVPDNSFHLDFKDNSSNAALGTDTSGNSNNFTVNNLIAVAGAAANQSQTWSSSATGYHAGATSAFDGNLTTSSFATGGANANAYVDITAITASKVEVYISAYGSGSAGAYYYCRQTNNTQHTYTISSSGTSLGWITVYDGSQISINRLGGARNSSGAAGSAQYGWRVDGVLLVNSGISGFETASDIDSLVDSPTNGTQTDTGVGNEVVGNYATLNPLGNIRSTNANVGEIANLSNGNLTCTGVTNKYGHATSTIAIPSSGKYYFEVTSEITSDYINIGIASIVGTIDGVFETSTDSRAAWYSSSGPILIKVPGSETTVTTATQYRTTGGVIGVAVDATNQEIKFYLNGTLKSTLSSLPAALISKLTAGEMFAYITAYNSAVGHINFGQRGFAHPVSGYKCLNTASLPTPTIPDGSKYFDTDTWSGNSTQDRKISTAFSPGFAWVKRRSGAKSHILIDKLRGDDNYLHSDTTNQNQVQADLLGLVSDGYELGSVESVNLTNSTYVGWAWDGGNGNKTYAITVANPGSGNKFYADSVLQPTLTLAEGSTYKFDQSASSNASHPLRFSTTNNGTHGGGSEYTTGVTTAGTPGSAGAFTQIVIAASAPTLYAYCTAHSGMGFQINTSDTGGFTIPVGSLNSSAYDQSQTWSSNITTTGNSGNWYPSLPATRIFDADTTNYGHANGDGSVTCVVTLSLSPAVTCISSVTFFGGLTGSGTGTISVNGGTAVNLTAGSSATTATRVSFSGSISSVVLTKTSNDGSGLLVYGFEIDGKRLTDSGVSVTNVPSIASQVMASPESGFSIASYTGATGNQTFGHGLNVKPKVILIKNRSNSADWFAMFDTGAAHYQHGYLNGTSKFYSATGQSVTNSTITLGNNNSMFGANGNNYVAYCFAPVNSYSAMGLYIGNGNASGPFVFTGFKPAWILYKRSDVTGNDWTILDATRGPTNVIDEYLQASNANAEAPTTMFDFLSNGFKPRLTSAGHNASGGTYAYLAFASNPFQSNGGLAR